MPVESAFSGIFLFALILLALWNYILEEIELGAKLNSRILVDINPISVE
jgi:hypothetical protein